MVVLAKYVSKAGVEERLWQEGCSLSDYTVIYNIYYIY